MAASSQRPQNERLPPGARLHERYEVMGFIGSGGFAQVYQCRDLQLSREVALKIFWPLGSAGHDPAQYAQLLERFRREASAAARVRHPNMVGIYDVQITDDTHRPYIVMEYLRGHDLAVELKRGGALAPHRALPLFLGALEALGEAHRLGIVHKDLKPSNLFLSEPRTRQESLRVLDFGVAHVGEEKDARITRTGHAFGTPGYLAPEYIQSQTVTPALDVYQMALILVEMLTGRRVVNDDNPLNCIMIHGTGALELPAPLMASPLGPVLANALQKNHKLRTVNADAFADALRAVAPQDIPSSIDDPDATHSLAMISGNLRSLATPAEERPPNTGSLHTVAHTVSLDDLHLQGRSGSSAEVVVSAPVSLAKAPLDDDDESDPTLRGFDASEITSALAIDFPNQPAPQRRAEPALAPAPVLAAAPALTAPPPRRGLLLGVAAAGVVALLAALGVAAFLLGSGEDAPEGPGALAEAPVEAAPVEEAPVEEAPVEEAPAAPPTEALEEPVVVAPRSVLIESTPAGAAVFIGERRLGATPLTLDREEVGEGEVELRLELPRHEPLLKTLTADAERLDATLEPVAAPVARRAPPREPRRDAPSKNPAAPPAGVRIAQ